MMKIDGTQQVAFIVGLSFFPAFNIFVTSFSAQDLEKLSDVATVIGLLAIFLAYIDFVVRKKHDRTLSVIDQLGFFRTEVLQNFRKIVEQIQEHEKNFDFKSLRIDKNIPDLRYAYIYYHFKKQVDVQTRLSKEFELNWQIVDLLNAMEEFSWRVILQGNSSHPSLVVIQDSFVQFVEQFTHHILLMRSGTAGKQYEGICRLYSCWSTKVTRENEEQIISRVRSEAYEIIGN